MTQQIPIGKIGVITLGVLQLLEDLLLIPAIILAHSLHCGVLNFN